MCKSHYLIIIFATQLLAGFLPVCGTVSADTIWRRGAGQSGQAIAPLEKVQTWYPSANVDAAYILGVCYIQTKDYPSARKAFAKMFGVPVDSAASYLFTARMLLRQDFGPVAEEYAKKAVELDPKLPLAHSLLGEIYLYKSRVPEAI